MKSLFQLATLSTLFLMGCTTQTKTHAPGVLEREVTLATETVENTIDNWDKNVSPWLFRGTSGMAVFPDATKKGFLLGRSKGSGVLSIQKEDGTWSLPVFIAFRGRSAGLQVGTQGSRLMLAFKNSDPVELVKNRRSVKSGNISVMAGPRGHDVGAGTDDKLAADVYSYAYGQGLFAGISLESMALEVDWQANMAYYNLSPADYIDAILSERVDIIPDSAEAFRMALYEAATWAAENDHAPFKGTR
jgi:lipid-binding SYLF domain-containing protein